MADNALRTNNTQSLTVNHPWVMRQTWSKLLFAHWPLKPEALRPFIPSGLILDTFDGQAWVGVVPFYMSDVRFRFAPPIPTTDHFCELNVRTYVYLPGGKPGVWFFSLDAGSLLAVMGARAAFHLPYYHARMRLTTEQGCITYSSERRSGGAAAFEGRYQPNNPVFGARSGTLEHWLTERYCLYAADRKGGLYRGDIQHAPWPLQTAEAELHLNTMARAVGISFPTRHRCCTMPSGWMCRRGFWNVLQNANPSKQNAYKIHEKFTSASSKVTSFRA